MFSSNLKRLSQTGRYNQHMHERVMLIGMANYRCDDQKLVFRIDFAYESIPQWNLEKTLGLKLVIDHVERVGHVELGIDYGDGYEGVLTAPETDSLIEWAESACFDKEAYRSSQGAARFFYEAVRQHPDSFQRLMRMINRLEWCLSLSDEDISKEWESASC